MKAKRQLFKAMILLIGMIVFAACSEKEEDTKPVGSSSLQVTPGKLSFSATGGTQMLTVRTTYKYFGYDFTADWLQGDFKDDPTYNYITITADPNTTPAARTATVKITGSNSKSSPEETVSVSVEQEGGSADGKTTVVSAKGGTVKEGDLNITFPDGTFNSDTKVSVSEAEKGLVGGEYEISTSYKVNLSAGVRKSFKVAIKVPRVSEDKVVMEMVTPGLVPSAGSAGPLSTHLDVTYQDGAYWAEFPAMDDPDETGRIEAYFTLINYQSAKEGSSSRTRDDTVNSFDLDMNLYPLPFAKYDASYRRKVYDKLYNEWIPTALNKVKELGFKLDPQMTIPYFMVNTLADDIYGVCNRSPLKKSLTCILLNEKIILNVGPTGDPSVVLKTLIHETLHYFQKDYDKRSAMGVWKTFPSMELTLDEATSVWGEQFVGSKAVDLMSDLHLQNAWLFLACFQPIHKNIHNYTKESGRRLFNYFGWFDNFKMAHYEEKAWDERFQNQGYGMATLMEYLTQKFGNKFIIDMYNVRKTKDDPDDTQGLLVGQLKEKGFELFTQSAYKEFVEQLGCRKLYSDWGFAEIVEQDCRVKQDTIGKVIKEVENTKPVYLTNYAYGYGALLEKFTVVTKSFSEDRKKALDGLSGYISQTTEGLTTWVYYAKPQTNNFTYELLGTTKKGSPLNISNSFIKRENGYYPYYNFYLVTIPDDFKTSRSDILSRNVFEMNEFPNFTKMKLDFCYTSTNNDAMCHWIPEASNQSITEEWFPVTATMNQKDSTIMITGSGTMPLYRNISNRYEAEQSWDINIVMDYKDWGSGNIRKFSGSVIYKTTTKSYQNEVQGKWTKLETTLSFNLKPINLVWVESEAKDKSIFEFVDLLPKETIFSSFSERHNYTYYDPPYDGDPERYSYNEINFSIRSGDEIPFTIYLYSEPDDTKKSRSSQRKNWTKRRLTGTGPVSRFRFLPLPSLVA